MPKVLIADKLSPAAADIFRNRGIEVDVKPGLSKEELIEIIGEYDGLAVRSACKPDADVIAAATNLKVIGRAGIGVDNIDQKAATAKGVVVMNMRLPCCLLRLVRSRRQTRARKPVNGRRKTLWAQSSPSKRLV